MASPRGLFRIGVSCSATCFVHALLALPVAARETGYPSTDCKGCHSDTAEFPLRVEFDPPAPNPGDRVTISVSAEASFARVAGIAIGSNGLGEYVLGADEPLRADGIWVTHVRPKAATDGSVAFAVGWQAPTEPGIVDFSVALVLANGNGAPSGDTAATTVVALPFGCDNVEVYADADGDGYGDPNRPTQVACAATEGFAARGNDCDDGLASTYPGAPELCNDVDDDCDGQVDEDVEYRPYYFDSDGDGYGNAAVVIEGCAPAQDTVSNDLDCDDFDRLVSPSSPELCDQIDNDCNGQVDDGQCAGPAPSADSAPDPAVSATPPPASSSGDADPNPMPAVTPDTDPPAPSSSVSAPAATTPAADPAPAGDVGARPDPAGGCKLGRAPSNEPCKHAHGSWSLLGVALLGLALRRSRAAAQPRP